MNMANNQPNMTASHSTLRASSITNNQVSKLIADDSVKPGALLYCKKNTGLYLIKRKNGGTFNLRITIPGRGRTKLKLGTFNASTFNQHHAAMKARQYVEKIKEGRDPIQEEQEAYLQAELDRKERLAEAMTVGEFYYNEYSRHQSKKREGKEVLQRIKRNFKFLFKLKFTDVKIIDVKKWEKERMSNGIHRDTIKADYASLNTMFNYAALTKIEEDEPTTFIASNPLQSFKLQEKTSTENDEENSIEPAKRRALTEQELNCLHIGLGLYTQKRKSERRNSRKHGKAMLQDFESLTYPHWIVPFSLLMLHTGLRQGDMYGLVWQCTGKNRVDLNIRTIFVTPEKTRDNIDPAKIIFPISDELLEILNDWWIDSGCPSGGYVFPNTTGKRKNRQAHRELWKTILKLGKFPNKIEMYSLRHNFISVLVAQGTPLLHIAKLVGHKSTKMIEEHYGHLCPNDAVELVNCISNKFSSNRVM